MNRIKYLTCLILLALAALTYSHESPVEPSTQPALKKLQALQQARNFHGQVLILQGTKVHAHLLFGKQDKVTPTKPTTLYPIASLTKTYTASTIMKLIELGFLQTDTFVEDILPPGHPFWKGNPPPWLNKITVHHLLSHTAGLESHVRKPGFDALWAKTCVSSDIATFISKLKLEFSPGERFHYSGAGYLLLGLLIEEVSYKTYGLAVSSYLLEPLNLKHTFPYHRGKLKDLISQGHEIARPLSGTGNDINLSLSFSEACIVASAQDVALFYHHLLAGNLLDQSSVKRMLSPGLRGFAHASSTGYGLFLELRGSKKAEAILHDGRIGDYRSFAAYLPQYDATVVVFSNEATQEAFNAIVECAIEVGSELPRHSPKA